MKTIGGKGEKIVQTEGEEENEEEEKRKENQIRTISNLLCFSLFSEMTILPLSARGARKEKRKRRGRIK